MESSYHVISKTNLFDLLDRLSKSYRVYVPYRKGESLFFGRFDSKKLDSIETGQIRQSQPLKTFLTTPRENITNLPEDSNRPDSANIIVGLKACDLASLKIQDFIFKEGDFLDPFYIKKRESTIIISSDCTEAKDTCFCLAMEGKPYPEKEFDINLSVLKNTYLVEVATEKGKRIVNEFRTFFINSDKSHLGSRDENRRKVVSQVEQSIEKRGTPDTKLIDGTVRKNFTSDIWKDFSSTCVECGACNLVCPTCHCFLLYDERTNGTSARYKAWDSCLYKTFARVAGGANPRKHLQERLRNRFDKKFDFFPTALNTHACTGCGRCIEACPGDIDIREVLKGLVSGKWNKPPNK